MAYSIYLNIPNYVGDSKSSRYLGWFEVYFYSWGMGAGTVEPFSVSITSGQSAPRLMLASAIRNSVGNVQIVVFDSLNNKELHNFTLKNAKIIDFRQSKGSGDAGNPTTDMEFIFSRVFYKTQTQNGAGQWTSQTYDYLV
ncbi:hypothetical protein BH11ARM1_BH11ARM1_12420 [soil metagenome]